MIELTLTPAEAAVLFRVLGSVGGNPNGYRGHVESIRQKLGADDLDSTLAHPYPDVIASSIMFREEDQIDASEVEAMDALIAAYGGKTVKAKGLTPRQEGYLAYQDDVELDQCPYLAAGSSCTAWRKGWFDARYKDMQRDLCWQVA